jgi:type II secretory pathway component PulL
MLFVFSEQLVINQNEPQQVWPVFFDEEKASETKALTLAEIAEYQIQGHEICLVLSCKHVGLHEISLPKLAKKDMLPAIASVLEDQLTQDFSKLHCFYRLESGKATVTYLVGLLDGLKFQQCLNFWSSQGIFLNQVSLDWFALSKPQLLLLPDGDAIVNADILGWVPSSLVNYRLLSSSENAYEILSFESDEQRQAWIVGQLKQKTLFDIRMKAPSSQKLALSRVNIEKGFKWSLLTWFVISFLGFLIAFGQNWRQYAKNQQWIESFSEEPTQGLELKLAKYRRFQAEKNKFWGVFIALQHAIGRDISIKTFDYTQAHLKLTVIAGDMSHFQDFKRKLIQSRLKVDVSQVLVQQEGIRANIDLRMNP